MPDPRDVGEDAAIKFMVDNKYFNGDFTLAKAGHHAGYFEMHRIYLDFRGTLRIHPKAELGEGVIIITWSHDVSIGHIHFEEYAKDIVDRPVIIDEGAFVGARALLYNCHIKHHCTALCYRHLAG